MLLVLLLAAMPAATAAPNSVTVADLAQHGGIPLNSQLQYWMDDEGLDLAAVRSLPPGRWRTNTDAVINFGQSQWPYWFRVQLSGLNRVDVPTYLRIDYPHLDELDLFFVQDGELVQSYRLGDSVPFSRRPIAHRVYLIPVQDLHGDRLSVYIRAQSQGPMMLPLDILTESAFNRVEQRSLTWYCAYFGIMLVMFFYNFFLYLVVRDSAYIYYMAYVATTAALQFVIIGSGFQYLWPQLPWLNNNIVLILTGCMPLAAVAFVKRFSRLREEGSRFHQRLANSLVLAFSLVLLSALLLPYHLVLKVAHVLSFGAIIIGFYLGLVYWVRGVRAARSFALAWFIYLVFIQIYLLGITGIIPTSVLTMHAIEIGSVLELCLLSLSFGYRLNEEKEMRLQAQEASLRLQTELNQNLDEIVQQRTRELEQANLQLRELSIKDGLTGVFNRRHFEEILDTEHKRAFREQNWLTLIMLDVDHFKQLNDNYGHPFGDQCLQRIATAVATVLRRPPDVVARYGGEEFVVLLPGTDPEGARVVAEKIRQAVAGITIGIDDQAVPLRISLGVFSAIPRTRDGCSQWVNAADELLYTATTEGRNRVVRALPEPAVDSAPGL